jgi:polyisoprenoid-binding protein YceI
MTVSLFHQPARRLRLAAIGLALALAVPLLAQEEVTVELDPAETHIGFTLRDVLHTVHGTFKLKNGVIRFDPATGAASGLVVVDATSGESGNQTRDRKMHKEILRSQQYPEITLTPVRIQGQVSPQAESQVEIQGVIRLEGKDREISLTAHVQLAGDQLTATTNFVVPYVEWGLKNPSTFILKVSDKVDIDIHTSGHLTNTSPAHPIAKDKERGRGFSASTTSGYFEQYDSSRSDALQRIALNHQQVRALPARDGGDAFQAHLRTRRRCR